MLERRRAGLAIRQARLLRAPHPSRVEGVLGLRRHHRANYKELGERLNATRAPGHYARSSVTSVGSSGC